MPCAHPAAHCLVSGFLGSASEDCWVVQDFIRVGLVDSSPAAVADKAGVRRNWKVRDGCCPQTCALRAEGLAGTRAEALHGGVASAAQLWLCTWPAGWAAGHKKLRRRLHAPLQALAIPKKYTSFGKGFNTLDIGLIFLDEPVTNVASVNLAPAGQVGD